MLISSHIRIKTVVFTSAHHAAGFNQQDDSGIEMEISLLGLRIKENMEKHHLQSTDFRVANVVLLMSIIVT